MIKFVPKNLGAVISIAKGKKHEITDSPSCNAKRLIGIEDLRNDDLIRYTEDLRGIEAISEDVLLAWDGANAGTIGYGKNGYIGSTIARLRVKSGVSLFTPFLGMFLKSKFDYLRKKATGATIPHISRNALESIPLPNINFDDQIRIAHLLGKVEGLISSRKQHLQQLDALLKSVFLEMFGDPVRNEKGWGKKYFSELLANIDSGKSPKCEARLASEDEWGVLKLGAVTRCIFDENENKALPAGISPSLQHEVRAGDLLFSRKNTYELVAACAYVFYTRPKLLLPDLIFRFIFKENAKVNPIYMWKLLTNDSQRRAIQSLAAGAAGSMPNISKANLKTVRLPMPPLELQNQFAAIVEKVESIKTRYQQSLTDLETLYGALSQKAFKGELDLSRVPLPSIEPEEEKTALVQVMPDPPQEECEFGLPDIDNLPIALDNAEARKAVLIQWLKAYCDQLGSTPFSLQHWIDAVQTRLTDTLHVVIEDETTAEEYKARLNELYPSDEVKLDANDYDDIKGWIFKALKEGTLTQALDDTGHCVQLEPEAVLV